MMAAKLQDLLISASEVVSEINPSELEERLKNQEILLVDVRENEEWQKGHLPKAVHLSKSFIELKIEHLTEDPNQEIVLYCGGGVRSLLAGFSLYQMGYRKLVSLQGGYTSWVEKGLPVDK